MRYLLDTDTCIAVARQKPAHVLNRFERLKPGDVGMSVVTYLELCYGAVKSQAPGANLEKVAMLAGLIPPLPLDVSAASHYARIRVDTERAGRPIGADDLVIAAHALALRLILITNNTGELSRVPGLRLDNWVTQSISTE
jgi:tRNA(fMet)-specific endonuclease VapC